MPGTPGTPGTSATPATPATQWSKPPPALKWQQDPHRDDGSKRGNGGNWGVGATIRVSKDAANRLYVGSGLEAISRETDKLGLAQTGCYYIAGKRGCARTLRSAVYCRKFSHTTLLLFLSGMNEVQASPLGCAKLGSRRAHHVLISEVDEAPWLLPRPEEKSFKFEKPAAIRAAVAAMAKHGMLVAPSIVSPAIAGDCRADGEAAFAASLASSRTCDTPVSQPLYRYQVMLDMTRSVRLVMCAIRESPSLACAIAATLGDDAALCQLSCVLTDPGAKCQPAAFDTPACAEDARTAHHEALARHGKCMLTVMVALGDAGYASGAPIVWPGTHTAAFHRDAHARGRAPALSDTMGVHLDIRSGDAVLLDSRLWHCGGAAGAAAQGAADLAADGSPFRSRSVLLLASFTSPALFAAESALCGMRTHLVGRFSLLNIEAILGRGGYGYSALGAAEDDYSSDPALEHQHIPRPIAALLRTLVESTLPHDELLRATCCALLSDALGEAAAKSDAVPVALAAARMVLLPTALLRTIRVMVGLPTQHEPRWAGLWRQVDAVLAAAAAAARERSLTASGRRVVGRDELRERWEQSHKGYTLSRASDMRPPADAVRFAALLKAAGDGDGDAVVAWLDSGGGINAQGGAGATTLLQRASATGQVGMVAMLLGRGAKVNLQDDEGSTALHAAAYIGHVRIVQLLVRSQAVLDVCDADGETALDWATERGHTEVVELLKEQKFEPRILTRLLGESQVAHLLSLRSEAGPVHDDGAGHEVIFLHAIQAAGQLSDEFDRMLGSLVQAMKDSDPRGGDFASDLNVRCVELHRYVVGGGLMDRDHKDSGSALTMSLALTNPATLSGGEFLTWDGDTRVVHRLAQGDAILFRSEDIHNVAPVKSGVRQTLVIELWRSGRNKVDRNR